MGRKPRPEEGWSDEDEWKTPTDAQAACCDCGWTLRAPNAIGAAALHSRKHMHTVAVDVAFTTVFEHGSEYA